MIFSGLSSLAVSALWSGLIAQTVFGCLTAVLVLVWCGVPGMFWALAGGLSAWVPLIWGLRMHCRREQAAKSVRHPLMALQAVLLTKLYGTVLTVVLLFGAFAYAPSSYRWAVFLGFVFTLKGAGLWQFIQSLGLALRLRFHRSLG
jgi:hypothetical protein